MPQYSGIEVVVHDNLPKDRIPFIAEKTKNYSEIVGLPLNKISIYGKNPETKPFENLDSMQVSLLGYNQSRLNLYIKPEILEKKSDEWFEYALKEETCHAKDIEEKLYGFGDIIMLFEGTPKQNGLKNVSFQNFFYAYKEYCAMRRYEQHFSLEDYTKMFTDDLDEILDNREAWFNIQKQGGHFVLARIAHFSMVLEPYIKSNILGYRPENMKEAVFELSDFIMSCFDDIRTEKMSISDTMYVVKYLYAELASRIHIPRTYNENKILPIIGKSETPPDATHLKSFQIEKRKKLPFVKRLVEKINKFIEDRPEVPNYF